MRKSEQSLWTFSVEDPFLLLNLFSPIVRFLVWFSSRIRMTPGQEEKPRASLSQEDSQGKPSSAPVAPTCEKRDDVERPKRSKPTQHQSDSSDGLSDSSDEKSDSTYGGDGTSHSEDNDPTYSPKSVSLRAYFPCRTLRNRGRYGEDSAMSCICTNRF